MTRFSLAIISLIFSLIFSFAEDVGNSMPEALDLTTELSSHPLGLDVSNPRFSWKMKDKKEVRGQFQTAYRILVATSISLLKEGEANVFDSKQVETNESVLVTIGNLKLLSKTRYFWTVKLWDQTKKSGSYAKPEWFETGILQQQAWFEDGAKWIESPIEIPKNENVDYWAKYTVLPLKYQMRDTSQKPTPLEFDAAMKRYYGYMDTLVWSASRMRREFDASSIVKARLYITGLGYYRPYLNGQRIGDRDLAPSDSHFYANVYYQVYDVLNLVKEGKNCLAVELVNGRWRAWFGHTAETYNDRPVLMARLELTDSSGKTQTIVTNEKWFCGESPIQKSGFWIGELYDAGKEQKGWNSPGHSLEKWMPAREAKVGQKLRHFTLDPMPPEKKGSLIPPVKATEPKPGVRVFDFGRMIGGRACFVFNHLKKGQRVVVRYSEVTSDTPIDAAYALAYYDTFENSQQEPGMLKFKTRGSVGSDAGVPITDSKGNKRDLKVKAGATAYTDMFVSAGQQEETWSPDFTYTGFRYLEVLGLENSSQLASVAAYDLHTVPEFIGTLTTDHLKLNKVLKGVQDTLLSCFHSQYQDNSGAERNPNGLNVAINDANSSYWFNIYPLWLKVAIDTNLTNTCFDFAGNMFAGMRDTTNKKNRATNISNCLHYAHLPYNLLSFYNDKQTATTLLNWTLRFVKETSEYTVWNSTAGSSDHIAPSSLRDISSKKLTKDGNITSPQFVKCGFIIRTAKMGISVAQKLGLSNMESELRTLLETFEKRVVDTYYDKTSKQWTKDYPLIQGRNTTLMYFMMQPRADDQFLCQEIVNEIRTVTNNHQATGSRLSYPILHALSQNGFEDEALRLLTRNEYPSLLDMIENTGGTIRESWGTYDSFAQIEGLSAMGNWFYTDLVGIEPDINHTAFSRFSLKPIVPTGVNDVNFSYESPRGKIESHWERKNGVTYWHVVIPPNSIANIAIPCESKLNITEGGLPAYQQNGVKFLNQEGRKQIFEIQSGKYLFTFKESVKDLQSSTN